MPNPTIYDAAKIAGVGVGTVSRVLNNSPRVSPETQEKVVNAIRELGFRRSKVARQLSAGIQHRNIGALLPFVTHPSFVERLRGVQSALDEQDNDFNLILYNVTTPDLCHEQLLSSRRLVCFQRVLTAPSSIAISPSAIHNHLEKHLH